MAPGRPFRTWEPFESPVEQLQRSLIRPHRPARTSATLTNRVFNLPVPSSSAPREQGLLIEVQDWLQNATLPSSEELTRTGKDSFVETRQKYDLAHSGLPSTLARVNATGNEYHVFELRWPYSEHTHAHPKLKRLMRDINAQHYALLVGEFSGQPTELLFHGCTIELAMKNALGPGTRQQLLEQPDGQPISYVLDEYRARYIDVSDVGVFAPPFVNYVATVEYPFREDLWGVLANIAVKVLGRAGWKYDCVGMNCYNFCEKVLEEIRTLAHGCV